MNQVQPPGNWQKYQNQNFYPKIKPGEKYAKEEGQDLLEVLALEAEPYGECGDWEAVSMVSTSEQGGKTKRWAEGVTPLQINLRRSRPPLHMMALNVHLAIKIH